MTHVDVVIIGAGLSGIGAARRLQDACPAKSCAILEGRDVIGGTWDLFRYPGIRSDSDMYTMGYDSKPWLDAKAIADGASILAYVKEAALERGIDRYIHFGHWVESAQWSSEQGRWTITARLAHGGGNTQFTCNFLLACSGYYNYEKGYTPAFKGLADFTGEVIHPQAWPDDLDYSGKRVVIIGSGATAMTLVPAIAQTAAQVTMLQRSPTYVVSMPAIDPVAKLINKLFREKLAYRLIRWKNVQFQRLLYRQTRKKPEAVKRKLLRLVRKHLGPDYDVDKHFTPNYNPWDQRLCLVPDADLFKSIKSGKAVVVTDQIKRFTRDGIDLESGSSLPADIVITATGLDLVVLGGTQISVDGVPVNFPDTFSYKGMMLSDVPNFVYTMGYINASWTLRSELVAEFVCRVVNRMSELKLNQCTPRLRPIDNAMAKRPLVDSFTPGYMQRAMDRFPRQGDHDPWQNTQNYARDKEIIRHAPLEDGVLVFSASSTAVVTVGSSQSEHV